MADCESPECLQALTRLQELRNLILTICSRIDQLNTLASNLRALAVALLLLAMGLVGIGLALLSNPLTFIAGIAALIAAGLVMAGVIALLAQANTAANNASAAGQDLLDARGQFTGAVSEVMSTCDQECWDSVDLNQPECPASAKSKRSARRRRGSCGACDDQTAEYPSVKEAA